MVRSFSTITYKILLKSSLKSKEVIHLQDNCVQKRDFRSQNVKTSTKQIKMGKAVAFNENKL